MYLYRIKSKTSVSTMMLTALAVFNPDFSGQLHAETLSFLPKVDYSVGFNPTAVSIGDINSDGKPDIVAGIDDSHVAVLLGKGNGGFLAAVDYPAASSPNSVQVGDFNDDGKADIVTANSHTNNVSILLGKGAGVLAAKMDYPVGITPKAVAVADINYDGKLDLVTANKDGNNVGVLLGKGDGSFLTKVNYPAAANSIAIGDMNNDGKPDLVTGSNGLVSSCSIKATAHSRRSWIIAPMAAEQPSAT